MDKDITGETFHLLSVIRHLDVNDKRKDLWLCRCECGKAIVATRSDLIHGRKRSCGASIHRYIDITGQRFGRLTAIKEMGTTESGDKNWLCQCSCGNKVVVRSYTLRKGLTRSCGCLRRDLGKERFSKDERFLAKMGVSDSFVNENGITLASLHKGIRNKSGVIGVSKEKKTGRWNARLYFKGRYVLLKTFDTFEDAVAARKKAEQKYLHQESIE